MEATPDNTELLKSMYWYRTQHAIKELDNFWLSNPQSEITIQPPSDDVSMWKPLLPKTFSWKRLLFNVPCLTFAACFIQCFLYFSLAMHDPTKYFKKFLETDLIK
jgi:hypothetical protein